MKISKRVREEAATLLSTTACNRQWGIGVEAIALDVTLDAQHLALDACRFVEPYYDLAPFGSSKVDWLDNWDVYFDICAEAEAMLRTGWSP